MLTKRDLWPRLTKRCALVAVALLAISVSVVGPSAAPAPAQSQPDPILFVHGWNSSASTWNTMINRFRNAGYPDSRLMAITYNSNQSNVTIAGQVRDAVNELRARTGATRVDIISHSMGGLSTRHYLKFMGGTAHVDDWVSLAGPNHGTSTAYACWLFSRSCRDMTPGSGLLNNLNSGNPVPGPTSYATWWSSCDNVINPSTSTVIPGAVNTQTACIGHSDFQSNATVFNQVRSFVA